MLLTSKILRIYISLLQNITSNREGVNFIYNYTKMISQISVWLSVRIKTKRFVFNRMRLFYFKKKPTTHLRYGGKTIKKHMIQWKNLFIRIFCLSGSYLSIYENERKWENIYKMLKAWLRNYRSILAFMKKEIQDTERETRRKILGVQLSSFY